MTASSSFRLAPALVLAALFALAPSRARAQTPPAHPTEAQLESARALYKEARELHRQGKLKEAIEKALESYRTAATPVTAMEAGSLLAEAGRLVEARDLVRGVASIRVSPRESDKGRDARQDAVTLAAALDARIPKIAIADRPAGADVSLDGKPLAAGSDAGAHDTVWIGVDPGAHSIVARAADRVCTTITVTVVEREDRTIDLHDACRSVAPRPRAPAPNLTQRPTGPAFAPPAQPSQRGAAGADPTGDVPSPLSPPGSAPAPAPLPRWPGLVIAAGGALAIGGGVVVALLAKSDYDSVASQCTAHGCTAAAYDTRQSARSRGDVGTVITVVGAAAVAGGVAFYLWPRNDRVGVAVGAGSVRVDVAF